jgi:20S proteasome alpha/beta subunit
MKKHVHKLISVSLIAGVALSLMGARALDDDDFSGYLKNYDQLKFVDERNAFVFMNESAKGKYQKIHLESVTIYSKTEEENAVIAEKASEYLENGVRQLLEKKGLAASTSAEGVLNLRVAITGTEKSKEDLKIYNFVPVAAIFRAGQAATGNVATYIDTMMEAEMTDSITGERVMAIVQKGISETEKRSGDELTFEDVVPMLDSWLQTYDKMLDNFLAKRMKQ